MRITFKEFLDKNYSDKNLTKIKTIRMNVTDELIDLKGIEKLVNLEALYIHNNLLTDISPLSNLINLEYIKCDNNLIKDISPLSQLTELRYLDCGTNKISDLSPLKNLHKLKYLHCENNEIENILNIHTIIKNLDSFSFRYNPISEKYKGLLFDDIIKTLNIEARKLKIKSLLN